MSGFVRSTESAKKITNLHTPEQDFGQNETLEPWLRQKNEPADWFMRFRRYLDMGSKRGLRALVAAEARTQVNTKESKKLSDVSVPRPWRRASKLWNWVERAEAYDLAEQTRYAESLQKVASGALYASKAYRIIGLSSLATSLRGNIKPGMEVKNYLAVIARLQSVMHDIVAEMEGYGEAAVTIADAAVCQTLAKQSKEHKDKP